MSWIVAKLSIRGIKGVLDRVGDFELTQERSPRSIAIYDPDARGTNGYADAIEHLFSEEGSLAEERGIEPRVSMTLVNSESGESVHVTRLVKTGQADDMPPELGPIVRAAPAHRVLRQHDLRRFVVDVFCSYDADHRERIVDVVAERLDGFQVFLTTHDRLFYSMLRDRLHDKGWLFERIEEG